MKRIRVAERQLKMFRLSGGSVTGDAKRLFQPFISRFLLLVSSSRKGNFRLRCLPMPRARRFPEKYHNMKLYSCSFREYSFTSRNTFFLIKEMTCVGLHETNEHQRGNFASI